jgi:diacylglycerol O-acyltransferase
MSGPPLSRRVAGSRPELDRPVSWGEGRDMNPLEALMWRAESDPRLRSTIVAVELLDAAPDWDRFLAAHDWATRLIPRFRMKVVEPLMGLGRPTWTVDGDFDLRYHVRRMRLPVPGSIADLLEVAEQIAMVPFDRHRPPWEAVLVDGLSEEGAAAFILKLHHSTTDGVGATQLLGMLHSRTREPSAEKPEPLPPPPDPPGSLATLARQLGADAGALQRLGRSSLTRSLEELRRPDVAVGRGVRYAASLRRVLAGPGAPSPLLAHRSLSRRFLALDVAFADLRGAARAAGGSLNDAYLAALLGGFRLYHEEMGSPIATLALAIPISVRRDGDEAGGNRFVGAQFAAPVGLADPARRIVAVSEMVRRARAEPAIEGMGLATPLLSRLPGPVISRLAGQLTIGNDLQASNVPGIAEEVFLAGARIDRAYAFAPLPGCAAMITLVSHRGRCCIGVNLDPAAIREVERFGACLEAGFAEVLALAPGPPAAVPAVRRLGVRP